MPITLRPPLFLLAAALAAAAAASPRVAVRVQALRQGGLRIGVVDVPGADLAIINANINLPIVVNQTGTISRTALEQKNGLWAVHQPGVQLKVGDVVFYWVYLSIGDVDSRQRGRELIKELEDEACGFSASTANGKGACAGQVLFEDTFDSLNSSVWTNVVQIGGDPDVEYCKYVKDPKNSFVKDGRLHLKATALDFEDLLKPTKLEGCTWDRPGKKDFCEVEPISWRVSPPTHSAWMRTKGAFSFKYGRVLIRARPASGDWIMSRMLLEPARYKYGTGTFNSGKMAMGVRGNEQLRTADGNEMGAAQFWMLSVVEACGRTLLYTTQKNLPPGKRYTDDLHDYVIEWTPRKMRYEVDGQTMYTADIPVGGYLTLGYYSPCQDFAWKDGTATAPFDEEFYISFVLMVAGRHMWPDGSISRGDVLKPWGDTDPRGSIAFIRHKDQWLPTWKSDFEIDLVKVTALG